MAGRDALVAGSIGPLGAPTRDLLHLDEARIRAAFREQVDGLLEGGVDLLILETFVDLRHLLLAADEARRATADLPIIAQLTFGEELELADGSSPRRPRPRWPRPVDVIGVNCGVGPHACLDARRGDGRPRRRRPGPIDPAERRPAAADRGPVRLRRRTRLLRGDGAADARGRRADGRRLLRDDAGPHRGDAGGLDAIATARPRVGRRRPASPASMAANAAPSFVTTPAVTSGRRGTAAADPAPGEARRGGPLRRLRRDRPAALDPDRPDDRGRALLRDAGVDLVNISDSAMARVRMGAMAVAFGIQHDLDLECLVHFTTRDRNLMAIESELLGAHALGVRNILALTGDPPRIGDYPAGTRRLGRRLDRPGRGPRPPQPGRGPGRARRSASRPGSRSPAPSTRPRPTPRPSGTGSSASSRPAPT